jgi:hypothetical protein
VTLLGANDVETNTLALQEAYTAAERPLHAVCAAPLPCNSKSQLLQAAPKAAVTSIKQLNVENLSILNKKQTACNGKIRQSRPAMAQAYRCYACIPPQHLKNILVIYANCSEQLICQQLACRLRYKHFNRPTPPEARARNVRLLPLLLDASSPGLLLPGGDMARGTPRPDSGRDIRCRGCCLMSDCCCL